MRWLVVCAVLSFGLTSQALAQDSQATDSEKETKDLQKAFIYEKPHKSGINAGDVVIGLMVNGSSFADIHETFGAKNRLQPGTFYEMHPVLRPFVNAGPTATYGIQLPINLVLQLVSHKLRNSDKKWHRVAGWGIPVIYTGSHTYCAFRNHDLGR